MKGVSLEYGRRQVRPMRSRFHPSSARGPASCYGDHGQSSGGRERGCELRRTPDIAARGAGSPLAIAIPGRNVARVVGHGQLAMTEVSIWAQALGVVIGVLLSSAFAVLLGWFIGWSHLRRLWPRRGVVPRVPRGRVGDPASPR